MALTKASLDVVYIWCGYADTLGIYLFTSNKKRGHRVSFVAVSNKIRVNQICASVISFQKKIK